MSNLDITFDGTEVVVDLQSTDLVVELGETATAHPSGNASAFEWRAQPPLVTTATTTDQTLGTTGAGFVHTLLDQWEAPAGIVAASDFFTFWLGSLIFEVTTSANVEVILRTKHEFGPTGSTKMLTHERVVYVDAVGGTRVTVPMSAFESISQIEIGTYTPPGGGASVEITAEDLALPSNITYELEFISFARRSESNRSANTLKSLEFRQVKTASYQFRQAIEGQGRTNGGGLSTVETDATLDGDGSAANPLKLADDAVGTAKIKDANVTEAKLAAEVKAKLNASAGDDQTARDAAAAAKDAADANTAAIMALPAVLSGTRTPTASDGKDTDYWIAALDNGTTLAVWENVAGTWIELGRATDVTVDLAHLENIAQDLRASVAESAWVEADDHDVDIAIVNLPGDPDTIPPSGITLTDAMFNDQGHSVMTAQQTQRQWVGVYVRVFDDAPVDNFRLSFTRLIGGGAWHKVTGPDETTYDYWFADYAGLGTGPPSRVFLEAHPGGEARTSFGGGFHGHATTELAKRLALTGGTMTGDLTLAGAPTEDLHAATKKYVDDNAGDSSSTDQTARDAAAAAQSTADTAQTAADTAQATADAALPKAGGTMTGKITLDGAPTDDLHAATKLYVDESVPSAADLATLEEYKGVWAEKVRGFGFVPGDVVEHPLAGGTLKIYYLCQLAHSKETSAPDLDAVNWHLLAPIYQGSRIDSWYHRGAVVTHNDGTLWVADQNIVRGDPAPGNVANTKWLPFAELADGSVEKDKLSAALQEEISATMVWHDLWELTADTDEVTKTGNTEEVHTFTLTGLTPGLPYEVALNATFIVTDEDSRSRTNNLWPELVVGGTVYQLIDNALRVDVDGFVAQEVTFQSEAVTLWPTADTLDVTLQLHTQRPSGLTFAVKAGSTFLLGQGVGTTEPIGRRAEAKADANQARLDALDLQGTGIEPERVYNFPDTTITGTNFFFSHGIDGVENDDLIVVTWANFHFNGLPFEHAAGGSTDAGGKAYFYARDLGTTEIQGRIGTTTGVLRIASDGSEDTLGSRLELFGEHSGTHLALLGNKTVSGTANDVPLLPPDGFAFKLETFRGVTPGQALASSLPDEIESLEDTINQLRAFASHQELVASTLPDPTGSLAPEYVYLTDTWRPLQGPAGSQGLIPYSPGEYQRTEGDTANRGKFQFSSTVVEIGDTNYTMRGFLQRAARLGHGNSLIRDFGKAIHNPVGGAMPGLYWGNDPSNPINNRASWQLWIKKSLAQGGQDPWNLPVQSQAAQFLARIYHGSTHTDVLFRRTTDKTVDGIDYIRCICPSNPQPGQAWIEALNFNDAGASTVEVEFRTNNGNTILWLGGDPKDWTWVDPTDNPTAVARINRLQLASKWEGDRIASLSRTGPGTLASHAWVQEPGVDGLSQSNSSTDGGRTWSDFLHLDMDEFAQLDEGSDGLIIAVERGGGFVTKVFLPWTQFARAGHADYEVFAGKWVKGTKTNQKSVWASVGCNNGDFRLRVSCQQADADSVVRIYRNN